MKLFDFLTLCDLENKSESNRATLLCFYHYKENDCDVFSLSSIKEAMINAGFNEPNMSRLKGKLLKGKEKSFVTSKENKNNMVFIPVILEKLNKEYSSYWEDIVSIDSSSDLLDELKFCGKRGFLTHLIKQINSCYSNNCYDACSVLMRRLFEIILIMAYQQQGIDDEIKDATGNYVQLSTIVKNAKQNSTLKLSRVKEKFDILREVGNLSAHNITYTASKKDVDDVKLDYRVMLEELYNKAGLI